jgi:hypothetical protein
MSDDSQREILPKSILEVIKEEYPEKYYYMLRYCANKGQLFTDEEWRNILVKSRKSYEEYLKFNIK